jgi:glutaredoxin 3
MKLKKEAPVAKVVVYSKDYCPYCTRAKKLLSEKGVPFEEIMVDQDPQLFTDLKKKSGMLTVPQIFINDQLIGGFNELSELESQGKLDSLLK